MRGYFLSFSLYTDKLEIKDMETKSSIHVDVYKRQAFQPFIEHDYCQNQEYQKLYAEYERTMSLSKKERMEAGLDEFPQEMCIRDSSRNRQRR